MAVWNLHSYTCSKYFLINPALHKGKIRPGIAAGDVNATDMEKSVLLIDYELDELGTPVRGGLIVYRKAGLADTYQSLAKGQKFTQAAYLSTSKDESRYGWTTQHEKAEKQAFFTITCLPQGCGRAVSHVSKNDKEDEVLFHRNTVFLVKDVETDNRGNIHFVMQEELSTAAGYIWGAHVTAPLPKAPKVIDVPVRPAKAVPIHSAPKVVNAPVRPAQAVPIQSGKR